MKNSSEICAKDEKFCTVAVKIKPIIGWGSIALECVWGLSFADEWQWKGFQDMSKKIQDMSKKFSLCANRYVERGFAHNPSSKKSQGFFTSIGNAIAFLRRFCYYEERKILPQL